MAYRLTRKLPKDFPNTIPDLINVNGVDIRTDLLVDVLVIDLLETVIAADLGHNIAYKTAHDIIACLLDPAWGEK